MQALLQGQWPFRTSRVWLPRAVGLSLLLALGLCGTASGQQTRVSGFVATIDGTPIQGVIVGVRQTEIRTTTDLAGRYSITAPPDAVLIFSAIGFRALAVDIAQRTTVDVIMERAVAV